MSLRSEIVGTDHDGHKVAVTMHHKSDTPPGAVVYTEPYRELTPQFAPFINGEAGVNMNVNAAFGGVPEIVYDGTDTVAWTGSEIVGNKVTFDSTDRAHGGTKSVKVDNPALNDIWQFDKGSDLSVSGFVGITLFVNIDKDWSADDSVSLYAYDTGSASTIGVEVLIEDYLNQFDFDVWQAVSIPFIDLGISATDFDAIRMSLAAKQGGPGKAPKFYLDDIQVEQSGTPSEFRTSTPEGKKYFVKIIRLHLVDALSTALTDNSMQSLSYNKLLGVTALINGILLQRTFKGEITFSVPLHQLSDFLNIGFSIKDTYSDGTNTGLVLEIEFPNSVIVMGGENSYLSFTVSDDLSGLVSFRAVARGIIEE